MEDFQSDKDGKILRPQKLTAEVEDIQPKRSISRLNSQQQTLNKALLERDTGLSTMYLGALAVLDSENPDRHALAAHGFRELMEKIPRIVEMRIKAGKETLKTKVIYLENLWKATCKSSSCSGSKVWKGEIDKPLSEWLKEINKFFRWFNEHYPRRKAETAATLRGLDSSGRNLPPLLEDLNIRKWEAIRVYFQGVAHHRAIRNPEEFSQWQDALERMLLDLLHPKTYEDFDLIDKIIQEGEGND
jgi:hypothetical protein